MSILVNFTDQLVDLNGFSLGERVYLLNLKFTLFGEWVFTQVNTWERYFQNVREYYDCSEFLNFQRGFKVFLGRSA